MKLPRFSDDDQGQECRAPTSRVAHQGQYTAGEATGGLSVLFAVLCIVDLFGVFPVITLPKSVISCGIYGIPLVLSVIGLQLYTAVLLGRCWLLAHEITPRIREKNRYPYAAVAELAFGAPARRLITFLIDATVFGSGVPNFILAAQSLQMFWWKISGGSIGVTYCIWMLVLALLLCPVMWLGSPKDMKPLALTSFFIVSTVAVSTWTCILRDDVSPQPLGSLLEYQPRTQDFLIAYGILAFQFDIHPMLLTLQVDMKDSRKINAAVLGGFGITGFMFVVTTLLAAARYGMDVDNNILEGIPPSIPLYVVALLVTVQLCLSSAVGNSALFQHIEDLLKIPRTFCVQRCLIRSSVVALAVFLAESVPRFDLVMGLVGSMLTGPLMFICPPLFFIRLCYMKSKTTRQIKINTAELSNGKQNGVNSGGDGVNSVNSSSNGVNSGGDGVNSVNSSSNGVNSGSNVVNSGGYGVNSGGNGVNSGGNGHLYLPLITRNSFQTKYKTFTSYNEIDDTSDEYAVKWYDVVLAMIVMSMGIAATLVATYSSWSDSIAYATYSPPCLLNATAAARSFLQ